MSGWTVTCPRCSARSPWVPTFKPVQVKCFEPRELSRQMRRQAERQRVNVAALATPCGEVFTVRPVPEEPTCQVARS